ncbi:hypoxanthine-guanine phosphoribosyltransferase [Brevundimonas vesicularis]|nr:hypoxanthine-guanine phosphoribosyltransferase [Brevundimonas vesicularis]
MVRRYRPRIMADPSLTPTVLLSEAEVARIVADLAQRIAPVIDDDTVAAVLLTGGLWFAADLTRALSRVGRNVRFDALWLASYGDEQTSRGRIDVYAPFQRPIAGRRVLILDDVFDTGLSLAEAVRIAKDRRRVRSADLRLREEALAQAPRARAGLRRLGGAEPLSGWLWPGPRRDAEGPAGHLRPGLSSRRGDSGDNPSGAEFPPGSALTLRHPSVYVAALRRRGPLRGRIFFCVCAEASTCTR